MKHAFLIASAVLLFGASPTLAQHHGNHGGPPAPDGRAKASRTMPPKGRTEATREYTAAHHKMMRGMNLPYTGDPDADFRIQMIPHHQGAIDMARVALRRATDPWTRQLAEAIIVEQQREIRDMQGWLARRGFHVPEGGTPLHVIGWNSYRTLSPTPGSLEETQGTSWTPGSGMPPQR